MAPRIDRKRASAIIVESWIEGSSPNEIQKHMRTLGLLVEISAIRACVREYIGAVDEARFYGRKDRNEDERKRPRATDPA